MTCVYNSRLETFILLLSMLYVKTKRYRKAKAQQTNQLHPGQLSFSREKEEMPWVGFEPTTLCSLGECSTNWATKATQPVGVQIYNTTQDKGKPQTTVLTTFTEIVANLQYVQYHLLYISQYVMM